MTGGSIVLVLLDEDRCYRAVASRDPRFDGQFVTAVRTTGIYCRPSCPAVTPRRRNVEFWPTAAAAQLRGFRACRRCLPDAVPGSPDWNIRADLAGRAMRLIGDGVVEREGIPGLATRLGYSERHVGRVLTAELGAGPLALARAHRAHTARLLIETTPMAMADIAFAAGFASIRQFNDTVREVYGVPPSTLRAEVGTPGATGGGGRDRAPAGLPAAVRRRGAARVLRGAGGGRGRGGRRAHVQAHAAAAARPGDRGAGRSDRPGARCRARVREPPRTVQHARRPEEGARGSHVVATLRLSDPRDLAPAVARLRRLLDLDADPAAVDGALAADPCLAPSVAAVPGIRLPGTVDPAETALRAVLGQQVSVAAARTAATRLAAALGEPLPPTLVGDGPALLFPTVAAVAEHGADVLTGPARRTATLRRPRRSAGRRAGRGRRP